MATNTPTPYDTNPRSFDQAIQWFRDHGFELLEAPGTANRFFLKKYHCSAAIEKVEGGSVRVFAWPGCLIGGEISKLVNKGYQQFLKTTKAEIAATAEKLNALHSFTEEFKEALNLPSLYNEGLGTVSESYHYDRVNGREAPMAARPVRPWDNKKKA